eukprot:568239-Rhodomonas_salina.1
MWSLLKRRPPAGVKVMVSVNGWVSRLQTTFSILFVLRVRLGRSSGGGEEREMEEEGLEGAGDGVGRSANWWHACVVLGGGRCRRGAGRRLLSISTGGNQLCHRSPVQKS